MADPLPDVGPDPDQTHCPGRATSTIHRLDGFQTYHSACEAVRATLTPESLHPLRLPNGRALLAFVVTRKRLVTAGNAASAVVLPAYATS